MRKLLLLLLLVGASANGQAPTPPAALSNWPTANTIISLTDPGVVNTVVGWDDVDGKFVHFTLGSGLTYNHSTHTLSGGGGAPETLTLTGLGGISTSDGLNITNTTPATVSADQLSPALHFQGNGWKTAATAGSQAVDWRIYDYTTQGTAAPQGWLYFDYQVGGTGYTTRMKLWDGAPTFGTTLFTDSIVLQGTVGKGYLQLRTQSTAIVDASPPTNAIDLYADNSGNLVWKDASDLKLRIFAGTLAADRTYTWPDKSGTVAMTSDIGGAASVTGIGFWHNTTSGTLDAAAVGELGTTGSVVRSATPTSGQILVGNAGGTAYAANTVGGDATLSSSGSLTVTKTSGTSFAASATTDTTNAANISSGTLPVARLSTNVKLASVGFTVDGGGSVIPTGKVKGFLTCPYSGTITAWNIVADTGTVTVKVWKIATGTAKPTSANAINTSGVALATGTAIHSTTLTDFTSTTVTANDIFAFNIETVASVTEMTFNLEITQN